ncbi:MAG TPA: hypothetical protein PLD88_10115, partial [Candidatus Berkiella sp.]|nr:hypothetical protein [Candidatus Berkiella sp.]
LVNHLATNKSHVIFIDEAHALAMTGDVHGGGVDALNLLKPFLTSGKIKCILATTPKELTPLAADKAFMRRFGILQLLHLSKQQMCEALRKKGDYLTGRERTYAYRKTSLRSMFENASELIINENLDGNKV